MAQALPTLISMIDYFDWRVHFGYRWSRRIVAAVGETPYSDINDSGRYVILSQNTFSPPLLCPVVVSAVLLQSYYFVNL
jgi:hypothetical protein